MHGTLEDGTPLGNALLKYCDLRVGRISAILPPSLTVEQLLKHSETQFTNWLCENGLSSLPNAEISLAKLLAEMHSGPRRVSLIEDRVYEKPSDSKEAFENRLGWSEVWYYNNSLWFVLESPVTVTRATDFLRAGMDFPGNIGISSKCTALADAVELQDAVVDELAKFCDTIFISAFDDCSYLVWEKQQVAGEFGTVIRNGL